MFAHQVIESLSDMFNRKDFNGDVNYRDKLNTFIIPLLKSSQKFHLGSMDRKRVVNFKDHSEHFIKFKEYMKMPYKYCWIDYRFSCDEERLEGNDIEIPKRGMLVYSDSKLSDELLVFVFNFIKKGTKTPTGEYVEKDIWTPPVLFHKVNPNAEIGKQGAVVKFLDNKLFTDYLLRKQAQDDIADLYILEEFMLLLNSKNIGTVIIEPSKQLNKSRKKRGKQELFTYKMLKVITPNVAGRSNETCNQLNEHNRIHFCRGHFKSYTQDAPLFGKIVGLWWWQAHVRGQNKDGIVMKDYSITTNKECANAIS
jgi:hypothetical protein